GSTAALFLTNQLHGWAHRADPPAAVRRLQAWGWILSPQRHALHHRHHDRAYCVTSGWLNPWLDRMRFFPTLERLVDRLRAPRRRPT
ncbi:MAG TPA: fatty acid desaturase CarF family protein, partial [Myxococcota bacterium]|nr:fatty acid desaturase CarF family protein [Myxococcota bacterium]